MNPALFDFPISGRICLAPVQTVRHLKCPESFLSLFFSPPQHSSSHSCKVLSGKIVLNNFPLSPWLCILLSTFGGVLSCVLHHLLNASFYVLYYCLRCVWFALETQSFGGTFGLQMIKCHQKGVSVAAAAAPIL